MIQCSQSTIEYFRLVPSPYNGYLCTLYTSLRSLQTKPEVYALASQLVRFGTLFNAILAYESHRQKGWWARRPLSIFLALAQLLSGAVASPLYFAVISYYKKTGRGNEGSVQAEEGWTVLLSLLFGYLLPVYLGSRSGWSDNHLTAFLLFPIYLSGLNTVLPPLLRPFLKGKTARLPIAMTSLLCIAVSCPAFASLWRMSLKYYWPSLTEPGIIRDMHMLILHDYLFVTLALGSYTFLLFRGVISSFDRRIGIMTLLMLCCGLGDPVGLIAWLWGYSEYLRVGKGFDGESKPNGNPEVAEERRSLLRGVDG